MSDKALYDVLEQIEFLFEKYSLERRATTQPYLLQVAQQDGSFEYHPERTLIRETLMEHVGSTPVLATALFPYLQDDTVNIGDSLTMLAIHDIGELIAGDENTFTKKADSKQVEYDAAVGLLHPTYHTLYDDVENQTSASAKYAKAIDKITPDIFDYLTPTEITKWRYKHFVGVESDKIIDTIVQHKRPYMLWNPFMTDLHVLLMAELSKKLTAR